MLRKEGIMENNINVEEIMKQIKADIENDKKLQDHALKSKELENNILNVLNKEDTLYD